MQETTDYLFVYGTLLDDDNNFAIYLKKHCEFYSKGKLRGKLYDLDEYPGAVLDENNESYVHGSIVRLINPIETLKYLDDYEGFGEEQDQPNLFIREIASVETDEELTDCWVYVYNLPVKGFRLIESGDYVEYRKRL